MKFHTFRKCLVAAATTLLAAGAYAQATPTVASQTAQTVTLDGNAYICDGVCGTTGANGDIGVSGLAGSSTYGFVTVGNSVRFASDLVGVERPTGILGNGSRALSQSFVSNGNISAWFNFITTDSRDFGDYAWARLIDTAAVNPQADVWLFTVRGSKQGSDNLIPGDLPFQQGTPSAPGAAVASLVNANVVNWTSKDPGAKPTAEFVNWTPLDGSNQTCFEASKAGGCGFTGWLNSQVTVAAGVYRLEVGVVNFGDRNFNSGLAFDVATMTAPVPEIGTAPMMLAALGAFGFFARRRMNRGA